VKRSTRGGVEDRWHRDPRRGEQVPYPADHPGAGSWCIDKRHADAATVVTTARHGRGKRWLARWVDHDGNERSRSFDRKAEAQTHIAEVTGKLATGAHADPRRSGETFGTVADQWLASKATLKPKTYGGYESLLETLILPKWRDVPLREIDHAGIQKWVTWLSTDPEARQRGKDKGGLSAARVIQAHQVVHQVLAYAVRSRYIAANPGDAVQLPRKATPEKSALTHEQVRQVAEASGEVSTMIYTLAYAGIRYGEAAALRVRDVDIERRRLTVSRSVTRVRKIGLVEGGTKTHAARSVPIPQFVAGKLAGVIAGRDATEYLFPGPNGGPMSIGWFRVRFDKAAAKVGLENVTPHNLRHTAGSLALASGASVVTVQKLLGHRNATTTMNVYSHMLPDDFDNLSAAMDEAARAAPTLWHSTPDLRLQ
jgi:integrase